MTNQRHAYVELMEQMERHESVPCQRAPEIFFPEDFTDPVVRERVIKTARSLCGTCPVQMKCFEYAMISKERHGIWGGTLPSDR